MKKTILVMVVLYSIGILITGCGPDELNEEVFEEVPPVVPQPPAPPVSPKPFPPPVMPGPEEAEPIEPQEEKEHPNEEAVEPDDPEDEDAS